MSHELVKKKIVILGGGFGGLSTALELGSLLSTQKQKAQTLGHEYEVTLIDRNNFQLFTPDLYEVASASKDIDATDAETLKKAVCIDMRLGLAQYGVRVVQANVEGVNPQEQRIATSIGSVSYDYLVVALGSEPFYFHIPGMAEHAIPFKWLSDAVRIRETILNTVNTKDQVHIIVCGAGPAGVELAAELRMMCEHHFKNQNCFALTLVEGKSAILPQFSARVQQKAAARLKNLGIRIQTDFVIREAKAGHIVSTDDRSLDGDIMIWAGGVKAASILQQCGLTLTDHGQIPVNTYLRSEQYSNIFALGDAAEVPAGNSGHSPMTAHEAVHQGSTVARNLYALLRAEQESVAAPTSVVPALTPYMMKSEGFVIAMGGKNGLVVLPGGAVLSGRIGWFARKYVDFRHFQHVLPFMQACSFWYRGMKAMARND